MAYTGRALEMALPFLRKVPPGTNFDVDDRPLFVNGPLLEFLGQTQADVKTIRECLPAATWKRTRNERSQWWVYDAQIGKLRVRIWGIKENPPQCKAIVEHRTVIEKRPLTFEDVQVEKDVIIGWDCNGGAEHDEIPMEGQSNE